MADRVIKYRGEFDASQILASLKKVRSEMEKGGVDSSIFKGVDKDIEKTEKLITQMMAKLQTGFKDQKEVIAFEKQIAQVSTDLSKIGIGLKNANLPENFKAAAAQITKMGNNLQNTVDSLAKARQETLAFADAQQKSGRYTKAQAQAIKDAVDNEEELLQAVKRVNEEQSKKAGASLARSLTRTKDGVISDTTRKSMAQSITTDYSNENTLALAGAAAGIQDLEKYKQVMSSVILEGRTLKEAMDSLQVEFNENDKEILESDNFLKIYAQDLKTLAFAAAETAKNEGYSVAKGNISKQANIIGEMGASNISGEFVANTSGYDASIEKVRTLEAEIVNLKSEIASLKGDVDANVNATNAKLDEENTNLQQNSEAWKRNGEATRDAAESADNFNNTFNNLQNIAKQVLSLTSAWRMLRQVLTQTYNDVRNLDKSFAEIAMVTQYSVSDMWGQYDEYAKMANELGQSTQSVVQASGLFYQQGLNTEEALSLTKDTMKLATLAGLDFQEATSQMTAALRAFHMEMDQGSHITDVYAELAAHAAATVNDIAYAMSKTASIANSAGMSFENTSAFLTQMIETTQEAPENIGTAMKTIIARFTELKNNVAGTADSEFEDLDYNKVDKALKSVGVSIKDATGQFRNLDEVFLELSAKWNDLDRNSQRYIATIAAGSRQQSRFIAMMENYDRTMELIETAQDSAGKSSEQFAKYQDTVEYKVNQLKNSWEQLRTSFANSDTYKSAIDGLTSIVNKIKSIDLTKLIAMAPIVLPLVRSFVNNFINGVKNISSSFGQIGTIINTKVSRAFAKTPLGIKLTGSLNIAQTQKNIELGKQEIREEVEKAGKNSEILISASLDPKLSNAFKELNATVNDTTALNNFKAALSATGMEESKVNEITQSLIDKNGNFNKGLAGTTAALNENAVQLEKFKAKTAGLQQGFQAIGQAAATAFSTIIAGADVEDALKGLTATLAAQSAQMALQWAAQKAAYALTQSEMNAIAAAGVATRTTMAGVEGVQAGTALGLGMDAGLSATGIGAIIVAAAAALTGIIAGIYSAVSSSKSLSEQLEEAEDHLKDVEEEISKANSALKDKKEEKQNLEDLLETYDELSKKIYKTEEEEEKLNETIKELKENHADIIRGYDDENNQIKISNELKTEKINKLDEEIKLQRQLLNLQKEEKISTNKQITTLKGVETVKKKTGIDFADADTLSYALSGKPVKVTKANEGISVTTNNGTIQIDEDVIAKKIFDSKYFELNENEKEAVADSITSIFNTTEEISDELAETIGDKGVSAIADLREEIKKLKEDINNTFSQQYEIASETVEEQYGETLTANQKILEASFRAANADKLTAKLEDIDDLEDKQFEKYAESLGIAEDSLQKLYEGITKGVNTADSYSYAFGGDEELKTLATALGITKENYSEIFDNGGMSEDEAQKEILKRAKEAIASQSMSEEYNKLGESFKSRILSVMDNAGNLTTEEYEAQLNTIQKGLKSEKYGFNKTQREEILNNIKEVNQEIVDNATNLDKIFDDEFKNSSISSKSNLYTIYGKIAEQAGEQSAKEYVKSFNEAASKQNLTEEQKLLFDQTIDWSEAESMNWEDFRAASLKKLKEVGFEGGEEFFDAMAQAAKENNVFSDTLDSAAAVQTYTSNLDTVAKAFVEKVSDIQSLISSQTENGFISTDDVEKLKTMFAEINEATGLDFKAEDYYGYNEFGELILDAEKLNQLYQDRALLTAEELKRQKELAKVSLVAEEAQLRRQFDGTIDSQAEAEAYAQWKSVKNQMQEIDDIYEDQITEQEKSNALAAAGWKTQSEITAEIEKQQKVTSNLVSNYKTITESIDKTTGKISKSGLSSLQSSLEGTDYSITDFVDENLIFNQQKYNAVIDKKLNTEKANLQVQKQELQSRLGDLKLLRQSVIAATEQGKIEAQITDLINERNGFSTSRVSEFRKVFSNTENMLAEIDGQIKSTENEIDVLDEAILTNAAEQAEIMATRKANIESLETALKDAQKSAFDAHEKVISALEDIQEAEEKVIEQTEKLNETLYGSDNYKNKSDNLYNYTTMLERLQKAADDAKDALDDISEGDDVQTNVNTYLQKARDEATARQAENEVIRQSIQNYQNVLNDRLGQEIANMNSQYGADMDINISDFYYKKGDRWAINFQALNAANIPDEISDYVEETVAEMNKLEDSIEDNADAIKKREKEIRELRKKGVQAEITLENEVANVLKEKYQEEVDNLKDKYKSMEEADNEYVDALKEAIDKQRQLRSRQNEWENLATKEKKLSLLSRDTSGANKLTTQKLQKEIQSDREKLLDNTIDSIINNLKELYETQKETRDSEIEYQEALLENTNFIKEANTIIQSWESADDAISFFYKNVKNISEMSEAQLEQETESWKDMYEAHTLYLATNTKNFNDTLQHFEDGAKATNEEIQEVIRKTSETLTNEATRSLNEISSKTSEAIKSAQDAVTDALDALAEKQKSYNEALESERQAVVSLAQAQKELNEARDAYKEALGQIDNQPNPSSSVVQQSTGLDITELDTMLRGTLIGAINRATDSSGVHVENIKWDKVIKDFNSSYNADFQMEDLLTILKDTKYHGVYTKNDKTIKFLSLDEGKATSYLESYPANERTKYLKFKTGGLVDYTGPAWVDGSPTKPEAFLNPEDTERIGKAAELLSHLSDLLNFNTSPTENITNNSIVGDTTINVTVNVENISDDYDVDLAIERVKQEIVDAAAFTGANVILTQ